MNISFFNGASGLIASQEGMNIVSHNIANSNTVGFKASKSAFDDLLYTRMAVNSPEEPLVGHGVKFQDSRLIYKQGSVIQTGHTLDFGLMGDGLFALQLPDGSTQYTRNGAFDISIEGGTGYLVNASGYYVLDAQGRKIALTAGSQEGLFDLTDLKEKIGIYDFPNPYGLEQVSGNSFLKTDVSGEAVSVNNGAPANYDRKYQLVQYALEQSGVNLADEMVSVIVNKRAYQINARMVQTADELEQIVNNLR